MKASNMKKGDLIDAPYFHLVNPAELESIEEYTAWLEAILHNPCVVWDEDGELRIIEIKQLVARINGLKIEIYSNEHPPPHFHVKSPNVNASFNIENCDLLNGDIDSNDKKKIKYWHKHAQPLLIEIWDSARPANCAVGTYGST